MFSERKYIWFLQWKNSSMHKIKEKNQPHTSIQKSCIKYVVSLNSPFRRTIKICPWSLLNRTHLVSWWNLYSLKYHLRSSNKCFLFNRTTGPLCTRFMAWTHDEGDEKILWLLWGGLILVLSSFVSSNMMWHLVRKESNNVTHIFQSYTVPRLLWKFLLP